MVDTLEIAKKCLREAEEALRRTKEGLGDALLDCIELLYACEGRIILTGIGKSALIAQKITATLNSTGSSAIFLHAADALHGDMGVLRHGDVVWVLSQSGESPEIRQLTKAIKGFGHGLIAMTGRADSFLARQADHTLLTRIDKEADPNNLAPTTSTTVQLVLGDAVALALQQRHGFEVHDFARIHPGGSLGKQLLLTVGDVLGDEPIPQVTEHDTMAKTLLEISSRRKGAVAVTDSAGTLIGIITDGDLRRHIGDINPLDEVTAGQIMTQDPVTISPRALAVDALRIMQERRISQILVVEGDRLCGLLHVHELLEQGLHGTLSSSNNSSL